MAELEKQLEKYRKEKDALDKISKRLDYRRSDLYNLITATEQLIQGSASIEKTAIPDDIIAALDKYLPPLSGGAASVELITSKPQQTRLLPIDPQNKTYLILSLFHANNLTSHSRGLTTGEVVKLVNGTVTRDDVHKILSRQSRPETARLHKQDRKFHLTKQGIEYIEALNEAEAMRKED
jgi:hypothetical protein